MNSPTHTSSIPASSTSAVVASPKAVTCDIETLAVTVNSKSGPLPGELSTSYSSSSKIGAVLCPGFAVGRAGNFVKSTEESLFRAGLIRWALRFNFSGHPDPDLNTNLSGFTFSKAVADFQAAVKLLRSQGAQKVFAIGSSTGVQPAILASCLDTPIVDRIIGRASVVNCFQHILKAVPADMLSQWKAAGTFKFPVGGKQVILGSDLLTDIESWDLTGMMRKLNTPLSLVHGELDKDAPLSELRKALTTAPANLVTLKILPNQTHDLSNEANSEHQIWMLEQAGMLQG